MAKYKDNRGNRPKNISGQRFGLLTAISIVENRNTADRHTLWLCVCDCGSTTIASGRYLRARKIISCGCAKRARFKALVTTHGRSQSFEYHSWQSAKERCFNVRNKKYPKYGGRGITMCADWAQSFEQFFAHIGPRPKGTTLDRIDNNRGYEPGNVRWATSTAQVRNRRVTIFVEHQGITLCLPEWAERLGIKYDTLKHKYKEGRWPAR